MNGGGEDTDNTFLTNIMGGPKPKPPTNTKPKAFRPNSSQRAGTELKNKNDSDNELDDDLDSEYRDQVFDFEQSQNLLNRAENWLDGKKNNFDNISMSSGLTGKSNISGKNYLKSNKTDAATHSKYRKKMLCDNLNDD